jgi:hypothetical protein
MSDNLTETTERFLALDLDTQRAALAQFLHVQLFRLQRLTSKVSPDAVGHWGSVLDDVPLLILSGKAEEIREFIDGLPKFYSPLDGSPLAKELSEAIELAQMDAAAAEHTRTQGS